MLQPAPSLRDKIAALPGKKLIFTNATLSHAGRVLEHLGMSDSDFDGAFDVEMADWAPKPDALPYHRLQARHDFDHASAVFFEDTAKNLVTARNLGWATAWIRAENDPRQMDDDFQADASGGDLEGLLDQILAIS